MRRLLRRKKNAPRNDTTLFLLALCLQVAQQLLKRLLITCVGFPSSHIANMPRSSDVCRPRLRGLHYGIIQPHRKKHRALLLSFFLKCCLDFLLYPFAIDRILRQHKQQLVIDSNCFINPRSEFVPDFQILRSEPTAHAFALEVGINALCKILVLGRITDKARVKLKRLFNCASCSSFAIVKPPAK